LIIIYQSLRKAHLRPQKRTVVVYFS